jgi:hypothetical protein
MMQTKDNMTKRIEAAVKMLFASGRQLDIEAAKLIEELNQNAQAVGRMGNGLQDEIKEWRDVVDQLSIDKATLVDEVSKLKAKLDAVGPMTRAKAEERFEEARALAEDNISAFKELAEVSEKLAKALGRELKEEDTPLLLADEVDREMLILKVQQKITQGIGERQLKTHQDYCAANHVSAQQVESWKREAEGWKCLDRIFAEDDDETPGA